RLRRGRRAAGVHRLQPRSAQPGKAVTVTVSGSDLTPSTRFSLPFKAEQKHLADAKHNPAQIRLQLTPAADVEPGVYPVRLGQRGRPVDAGAVPGRYACH